MPKQLKVVEDTLASYLKISFDEAREFVYYTFETNQTEYWDILGIHYQSKNPLIVDVRLMHIDQEACDWEPFVAERDAPGYITFNPTTYLNIITFFEMLLNNEVHDQDKIPTYFFMLNHEELVQFHFSSDPLDAVMDTYYRYVPDIDIQDDPDVINLVCFPHWSPYYGVHQISSLWLINLPQEHLKDPQFDIISDADGLGTLRFNESALEDFILLLKKNRMNEE